MQRSQGNDIWAMAVIEEVVPAVEQAQESELQQLLQEFEDVFQSPVALPPTRFMIIESLYCLG